MNARTFTAALPSFNDMLLNFRDDAQPEIISPLKFATTLNYQPRELAELAHVHPDTVQSDPISQPLQQFMSDSVRVIHSAAKLRGSFNDALAWFRNHPIQDLGQERADRLVSDGKAEAVLAYLDELEAGFLG